jgi:hypothetical protein
MRCVRACLEENGATHVTTDETEEVLPIEKFFEKYGHPMAPDGAFITGVLNAVRKNEE